MKWPGEPLKGRFVKRYKRFFADCILENGEEITAHCANTGSMKTCLRPNAPVLLSKSNNPKRKLPYSLLAIEMNDGWVGVHTGLSNQLVKEGIENKVFSSLIPSGPVKCEVRISDKTRLDLFLIDQNDQETFIEIKNTTLLLAEGTVGFPDTITQRGQKHLRELMALKEIGKRTILIFCVQRHSATQFMPSWKDDPTYAELLGTAAEAGVEILAAGVDIRPEGAKITRTLPVNLLHSDLDYLP